MAEADSHEGDNRNHHGDQALVPRVSQSRVLRAPKLPKPPGHDRLGPQVSRDTEPRRLDREPPPARIA